MDKLEIGPNGTVIRSSDKKIVATMNLKVLTLPEAFRYAQALIKASESAQ